MTTLGKYELHEVIGEGSLGTVYRAMDASLGQVVAIKVLNPAWMADGKAVERFMDVVGLISQLNHYNIVPINEVGQENGQVFIVMPYLQRGNLAKRLKAGPLPYDQALYILRDVCAGLGFAHARGRVHGDLKPANILFNAGPCAVIADFGLEHALAACRGSGMTGSPFYRAPELWNGMPPSPAADVYALGCILGEMLTGKPLFAGDTPDEVRSRHLSSGPEWEYNGPPTSPAAGCAAVVERALQRDPAQRFASAADFWAALLQPAPWQTDAAANAPADLTAGDSLAVTLPGGVEMQFVRVPAGQFDMDISSWKHGVYLDEYWMGKYPVTNAQYAAFVNAVGWRAPWDWKNGAVPDGKENHPVVNVDWQDAATFCEWAGLQTKLGLTLPTEAQWEKAARGTDDREYPWGDEEPNESLYGAAELTTAVGQHSPQADSPYGCADMAGNVHEWCADWYGVEPGGEQNNPPGPLTGKARVARGGYDEGRLGPVLATYERQQFLPYVSLPILGFRCCINF